MNIVFKIIIALVIVLAALILASNSLTLAKEHIFDKFKQPKGNLLLVFVAYPIIVISYLYLAYVLIRWF